MRQLQATGQLGPFDEDPGDRRADGAEPEQRDAQGARLRDELSAGRLRVDGPAIEPVLSQSEPGLGLRSVAAIRVTPAASVGSAASGSRCELRRREPR